MRVDFILNEMLKKVDFASIWVETVELKDQEFKDLDKGTINRL